MPRSTRPVPELLQTQWHQGLNGLEQLRPDWQAIDPSPSLLTSYGWHRATAEHLIADHSRLWFCRIANAANQPIAIVPAHTTRMAVGEFGFRNVMSLDWNAHFPLFDFPLAADADAYGVASAILKAFRDHPYPWQVIYWGRVLADSNAARIARAMDPRLTLLEEAEPCHLFDVRSEADETGTPVRYQFASKNLRSILTQGRNRLQKLGPVKLKSSKTTQDTEAFLAEFLRVEAAGWKGATGTATHFSPSFIALMRTLIASREPGLQADMVLLFSGEEAIAAQFCITSGRTTYLSKQGYDERFAKTHPGHVLTSMLLNESKLGDRLDYLSGISGAAWRKPYRPIDLPTIDLVIFRSLRQRQWTLLRRAASRAKRKLLKSS